MLNNIPDEIVSFCEKTIGVVHTFEPASGGCINNGGKVVSDKGSFFIKWNDALKFPLMFTAESRGLELLSQPDCIQLPQVIGLHEGDEYSGLLLEYIDSAPRSPDFWKHLGQSLACMHQTSRDQYGLAHSNYIGSLKQCNGDELLWCDFLINQRLRPQIELAQEGNKITAEDVKKYEQLEKKLESIIHEEKPALIHGDLWNGNFMIGPKGNPVLIDPAVSYSHREMELAFTRLFGGFDQEFYDTYQEVLPTDPGFEERIELYTLYPLLVHVNLFGGGYREQAMNIINRFL